VTHLYCILLCFHVNLTEKYCFADDKAIDFPSAQYIIVYFLKKIEKRNSNAFAGKGLIRFDDFPRQPETVTHSKDSQKRRMY